MLICIVSFVIVIFILFKIAKILNNFFNTNMIEVILLLQLISCFFLIQIVKYPFSTPFTLVCFSLPYDIDSLPLMGGLCHVVVQLKLQSYLDNNIISHSSLCLCLGAILIFQFSLFHQRLPNVIS